MTLPGVGATGMARPGMYDEEKLRYERFFKMDPPQFQGGQDKNAYEFLVSYHKRLQGVGLVQTHGVDYTALPMRSPAKQWWHAYVDSRPAGSPPMT